MHVPLGSTFDAKAALLGRRARRIVSASRRGDGCPSRSTARSCPRASLGSCREGSSGVNKNILGGGKRGLDGEGGGGGA